MYQAFERYIIKIFIAGCFLFHLGMLHAQTYYVSSATGDDRNDGRSPATAWKTIDQVNRQISMLRPGSSLLFERGGVYYGSINVPSSVRGIVGYPITFGAYGEGDNPIISGAKQITGWKLINKDKNLWKASVNEQPVNIDMLFINGKKYYPARFPNKGYRTVSNHYSGGLQDKTLKFPDGYWNGATVAFRVNDWSVFRDTVAYSYSDGRIDKVGENSDEIPDQNWGYFFQNHINALDTIGEWVYDKQEHTLTLCTNENPNDQLIEYMDAEYGIRIDYSMSNNRNCYIHVEGLCFQYYRQYAIYAIFGDHVNIKRNVFKDGMSAIYLSAFEHCEVVENVIQDMEVNGILVGAINYSQIHGNIIRKIGLSLDGGQNGGGICCGIILTYAIAPYPCNENKITMNRIDSIGYSAISFTFANNTLIKNNIINYCMLSLHDGGGIYTAFSDPEITNNQIIENMVFNCIGNSEGTPTYFSNKHVGLERGIFLDNGATNIKVEGNTVYNSGIGIFLHGTQNINIVNNVLFNNVSTNIWFMDWTFDEISTCSNNNIQYNYMYGKNLFCPDSLPYVYLFNSIYFTIISADFDSFTTSNKIDNNYISAPFYNDFAHLQNRFVNRTKWTNKTRFDIHSRSEPISYSASGASNPDEFAILVSNTDSIATDFLLGGNYISFDSTVYHGVIRLQPFSSAILFKYGKNEINFLKVPIEDTDLRSGTTSSYQIPKTVNITEADTIIWQLLPAIAGIILSVSGDKGSQVTVKCLPNNQTSPVRLMYGIKMNNGSLYVSKGLTVMDLKQPISDNIFKRIIYWFINTLRFFYKKIFD